MNKQLGCLVAAVALCAACSSNDDTNANGTPDSGVPGTDSGPVETKPTYALTTLLLSTEGNTTYVNLFDTLDITSVDFAQAREFPGASGAAAIDGKLFISSGESPTVTRFDVTNGVWTEEGKVSFASYGLSSSPLYMNAFASAQRGYMSVETVDRVTWDPTALAIVGTQHAPAELPLEQEGYKVRTGYDRSFVTRDKRVFWPFYWSDDNYVRFAKTSKIAVYDADTDTTRALLDAPCPSLDFATQDEEGNIYFSNWVFSVTAPIVYDDAPTNCMVRVKHGEETIDKDFLIHFSDLTEGREAAAFHYLANGKGFLAVFHKELVTVTPDTDPKALTNSANWRFWTVDLNARTAAPMEGIDLFAGGYNAFEIDGRAFVLLPSADYGSTTTYEILPGGNAVKRFESKGWGYQLTKVK